MILNISNKKSLNGDIDMQETLKDMQKQFEFFTSVKEEPISDCDYCSAIDNSCKCNNFNNILKTNLYNFNQNNKKTFEDINNNKDIAGYISART